MNYNFCIQFVRGCINLTILKCENLKKSFGDKDILDNVNLSFDAGYIHLLNGKNGSGKSTFLKMLYGLLVPDAGNIYYKNMDIEKKRRAYLKHIGIVNADDRSLYHKLTAYENLYYIGRIMGVHKQELDTRIKYLLDRLHLVNDTAYVETFSTGMKKKVMVARALINQPDIVFADEVLNGLDTDTCAIVEQLLQETIQQGKTVFLVSHTGLTNYDNVKQYTVQDKKVVYD